jgi:hypothetical protein
MHFTKKHVLPAVENSVVVGNQEQQMMEMIKTDDNYFEVGLGRGVQTILGVTLALASLDFKWALE